MRGVQYNPAVNELAPGRRLLTQEMNYFQLNMLGNHALMSGAEFRVRHIGDEYAVFSFGKLIGVATTIDIIKNSETI